LAAELSRQGDVLCPYSLIACFITCAFQTTCQLFFRALLDHRHTCLGELGEAVSMPTGRAIPLDNGTLSGSRRGGPGFPFHDEPAGAHGSSVPPEVQPRRYRILYIYSKSSFSASKNPSPNSLLSIAYTWVHLSACALRAPASL
jgi:hypothetical protein